MLQDPSPRVSLLKARNPTLKLHINGTSNISNHESHQPNLKSQLSKTESNPRDQPKKSAINMLLDSVTSFRNNMKEILKKTDRNEEEAKMLYAVLKDSPFFKRFTETNDDLESDAPIYLCQNLKYEAYPAGSVIFEQGDPSNGKLYIVYSGTLSVIVKQNDLATHENLKNDEDYLTPTKRIRKETTDDTSLTEKPVNNGSKSKWQFAKELLKKGLNKKDIIDPTNPANRMGEVMKKEIVTSSKSNFFLRKVTTERRPSLEGTVNESPLRIPKKESPLPSPNKRLGKIPERKNSISFKSDDQILTPTKFSHFSRHISDNPYQFDDNNSENKLMTNLINNAKLRKSSSRDAGLEATNKYGTVIDCIEKGGFFGEKALHTNQQRGATIIANTDTELLIVTKDIFDYLKSNFDKKKNKIINFMQNCFPKLENLASRKILENLFYLLEEKQFDYGNIIIHENDPGEKFYLLFEGECELIRSIQIDETQNFKFPISNISSLVRGGRIIKENLIISKIGSPTFFGEEVLFKKPSNYYFTVRVCSTKAVVLCVDKSKFTVRFPRNVFHGMKDNFNQKSKVHAKRIQYLMSTKFKNLIIETSDIFKPDEDDNIEIFQSPLHFKSSTFTPKPYYNGFKTFLNNRIQLSKEIMNNYHLLTEEDIIKINSQRLMTSPQKQRETVKEEKEKDEKIKNLKEEFLELARDEVFTAKKHKRYLTEHQLQTKISSKKNLNIKLKTQSKASQQNPNSLHLDRFKTPSPTKINSARVATESAAKQTSLKDGVFLTSVNPPDLLEIPQPLSAREIKPSKKYSFLPLTLKIQPISSRNINQQTKTWNQYYSKIIEKMPHLKSISPSKGNAKKEDIDNIKVDLGRPDPTVEQKYKVIKMKMGLIEHPKTPNLDAKRTPNNRRALSIGHIRFRFLDKELQDRFNETLTSPPRTVRESSPRNTNNYHTPVRAKTAYREGLLLTESAIGPTNSNTIRKDSDSIQAFSMITGPDIIPTNQEILRINKEFSLIQPKKNTHEISLLRKNIIRNQLHKEQPSHKKTKSLQIGIEKLNTARF